jgi:hypothetical protein
MSAPDTIPANVAALTTALRAFGWCRWRWAVLAGLGRAVLAGPGLLLAWVLLDWAARLPPWPLILLFALALVAGLAGTLWWFLPPLCRRVQPEREALLIEARHGRLDNLLIGALQLGREAAATTGPLRHSPVLVAALVARAVDELRTRNPAKLLDLRGARRLSLAAGLVVVASVALTALAPGVIRARGERLQAAWTVVLDTLFPVKLAIEPGDVAVLRDSPVTVSVTATGAHRSEILLVLADEDGKNETRLPLTLAAGRASHTVAAVAKTFRYHFVYAAQRSRAGTVMVGDRPEIAAISYELAFPAYTGQAPRTLTGRTPKLQALAGTNVLVSFAATTELHPDLCYVQWQGADRQPVTVSGRFGHFSFAVDRPDRLLLHLAGKHGRGFEMAKPLPLEVAVDRDQPPTVQLAQRKDKLVLLAEEAAGFALAFTAEDDFGVAEIALNYRIDTIDALLGREPRQGAQTRLVEPAVERLNGKFTEIFKGLDPALQPGDRIRIELTAKDNNTETGPGVGRSKRSEEHTSELQSPCRS